MTNMPHSALIENLPHRRLEAWKWTDVRGAVKAGPSGMTTACALHFSLPSDLIVSRENIPLSETHMGEFAEKFGGDAYVIKVPAWYRSELNVVISNIREGNARVVIELGEGAELTVEEIHEEIGSRYVNLDIRFELAKYAKLTRNVFHYENSEKGTRIVTSRINAWTGADVLQHTLSFGAGLSRFETRLAVLGTGVGAEIHGAYLLDRKSHCDMTSYVDLTAPSARVRQSVKGIVTDKARGVFQGKFHVRRPAQLTDAEMRHDAIMLSDTCEVRSKPELEIYADDVACAHGNTVGALDESALFYMRQRGIPIADAKALLVQAFVMEAFEKVSDKSTKNSFGEHIEDWLEEQWLEANS